MLYDYLKATYGENEPIFVSEIRYGKSSTNYIRQQVKLLTDAGKLKRYDTGIYFIPKPSVFRNGSQLSRDKVIKKKYLLEDDKPCGYISGVMFANELGLTTQVPMTCEIVTNKATNDCRKVKVASSMVILRKPRVPVTQENYKILQLLDLLKDIDFFAEAEAAVQQERILLYMREEGIRFEDLEQYLPLYPEKIYKNMYDVRLLNGISA